MLENLKYLKNDMVAKKWTICSFIFVYKRVEYIVLVKRFVGREQRIEEYALVKLHFIEADNLYHELQVEANSQRLIVEARTLREFFGIEYGDNLGNILKQFTNQLGESIPKKVPEQRTAAEQAALVNSLSRSDAENPNKIYCYGVKRNSNGGQRSEFNSDKTKLLRPDLFRYFENDTSISFCYSDDINKENNDSEILRKFSDTK
ncbi:hypothetical protein ATE35_09400 [Streptococcus oralis subsp. tigurinus]|uniref:Uncharacterized protein n=1 Tax=Streptococcus oralis subsp. tigurinus TaxID=1077464 RepID=A0A1X0WSR7_STROR|nr:DUF6037 family protein [Streptococcus oralis]EMG32141.1 hypothetical protein H354_08600 [Streptococcus oralis subsp. tigurinus AZ_3a]ORJ29807.1 hypothetical protein ATE35_09400 [Streptococcus oralis subsp. tigurinus]